MKSLLLLHCYLLLIGYSVAPNVGRCEIDGIADTDYLTIYKIDILDTQIDTEILSTTYKEPLTLESCTPALAAYADDVTVTTNGTNFIIKTTPAFANFDQNTAKQSQNFFLMQLECNIRCAGLSTLTIQIAVYDINTHAPQFSKENYEYKIATPIMPVTDFSIYGDRMVATDVDFSNNNIVFTIEPDDFSITTLTSNTVKDYTAVFAARNVIQIVGSKTYSITATDSGIDPGPLSSTTTLTLTVDPSTSLDIPSFERASYSFNYTVDGTTVKLIPLDNEAISILTNKIDSMSEPELIGDYKDYFDLTLDKTSGTIDLIPKEGTILPTNTGPFILLTLSVSTDNKASASLIVHLPESDVTPEFGRHYYTGTYNDITNTVTLDNPIEVVSGRSPDVSLSGDEVYAQYFTIEQDSDQYKISVTEALPQEILESEVSLALTLVAAVDGNEDYATLVINLPPKAKDHIRFSQPLYEGTYQVIDGRGSLQVNGPIKVETEEPISNIHSTISGNTGYEGYFGISSAPDKTLELVKTRDLPEDALRQLSFIPLILTVEITGTTEETSTVVNVAIEHEHEEDAVVLFPNLLYNGKYEVVDDGGVITTDEITIVTEEPDSDINVIISSDNHYEDYFTPIYSNKKISIGLATDLPEDLLKQHSFIPLILNVGVTGKTDLASAVLNVEIDYNTEEDAPVVFPNVLFNGKYEIVNGNGVLTTDEITVVTEEPDDNIDVAITSGLTDIQDYFRAVYLNKKITIEKLQDLPESVLRQHSIIPLILTVGISGTDYSSAVLNVAVDFSEDEDPSIEFAKVLYSGKYQVTDGTGVLAIDDEIAIVTDGSNNNIDVIISNEYAAYFNVTQSDKIVTVSLRQQLPTDVLESSPFIPVTLRASITGTSYHTSAVLNIEIEYDGNEDLGSLDFTTVLYTAEYTVKDGKGELKLNEEIKVVTDRSDDEIKATIDDAEYAQYFEISYSSNTVKINLEEDLPQDIITKTSFIALPLKVVIKETTHTSSAVLNINIDIPGEEESRSVVFSNVLYHGTYEVTDGTGVFDLEDKITVVTEEPDGDIRVVVSNEYQDFFSASYSNKVVDIALLRQLPTDILNSNTFIPITLQVYVVGTSTESSAVLNIKIIYDSNDDPPGLIQFGTVLYNAQYSVIDGKGSLEFEEEIKVITDRSDDEIEPSISEDSAYKDYFSVSYAENTVSIKLENDLPQEVLVEKSFITLTLTVGIKESTHTSLAVLNIEIEYDEEDRSLEFSNLLYHGTYEVTDGTGAFNLDDRIAVVTEEPDGDVRVVVSNEYQDYFSASYSNKVVDVQLRKQLPTDILTSNAFISITLQVFVVGTSIESSAVVNVKIIYDSNDDPPGLIEFGTVLYNAKYSVIDGKGNLEFEEEIEVITDRIDDEIESSISEDSAYKEFFSVSYTANTLSVKLERDLPQEVLIEKSFITLTLAVRIKETTHRSLAVLNIGIEFSDNEGDSHITFSNILYHGKYEVTDGTGALTIDNLIEVITDESDDNIEIIVSNEYDTYFDVSYSEKIVSIALARQLSTEIVNSNSFIPITLQVSIKGTSHHSSSVLNIRIIYDSNQDPGSIEFSDVLYTADYLIIDGKGVLRLNETIEVITDRADSEIEASISDDSAYKQYFTISYSHNIVSIQLKQSLPQDVLAKTSVIALTLTVGIKETTHRSSAVLNVILNNGESGSDGKNGETPHMKTIYITVITVLSVLLVGLIASGIGVYYFKIRNKNYANLEEEDGRVRFNKNVHRASSDTKPASSLEDRRPTGFVFNPVSDDFDGFDSINGSEKNRRKSVAFDDNVEKLQIEPSVDEDNVSEDNNISDKSEVTHV